MSVKIGDDLVKMLNVIHVFSWGGGRSDTERENKN